MENGDKLMEGPKYCDKKVLIEGKELGDLLSEMLSTLLAPAAELERIKRKDYLTEQEVAIFCSVSTSTLRSERSRRQGPAFIKDGKRILYTHKDLREYFERRRVKTRG